MLADADFVDQGIDLAGAIRDAAERVCHFVEMALAFLGLANGTLDQAGSVLRRLGAALGEIANFVGDHREAQTGFSGARRLDGGVERQNVGLESHAFDHLNDLGDLVA